MISNGDTLQGRYRILRPIGEGAMGAVYEAEHVLIHRRVAIKVLHAATAKNAEASARFAREAQASGRIPSDHVTEVLDLGQLENGAHFIVMEYLSGETLAQRFEHNGRLPARELIALVRQVLVGLAAAHEAGVVHRDIKPDNVFVLEQKAGQRDFVKIMDFGVSKFRESEEAASMSLTRAGSLMGTPCYMSPEQARGSAEATKLSDLYAVGVMLYEGLTGGLPFESDNLNDLLFQVALGTPRSPRSRLPGLDAGLESIVAKAMARAPEQRFQSAAEFIGALDAWSSHGTGVETAPLFAEQFTDEAAISTSPLEHSLTVTEPQQRGWRAGWLAALALVVAAAGFWLYRPRSAATLPASASAAHAATAHELKSPPLDPSAALVVVEPAPSATAVEQQAAKAAASTPAVSAEADKLAALAAKPVPRVQGAGARPPRAEARRRTKSKATRPPRASPTALPSAAAKAARPDWGY